MANSLSSARIRDMMWPAAYHYLGVSGQGDKGFNMYGKQAADQEEGQIYKSGKLVSYTPKGSQTNIVVFRYAGDRRRRARGDAERSRLQEAVFRELTSPLGQPPQAAGWPALAHALLLGRVAS